MNYKIRKSSPDPVNEIDHGDSDSKWIYLFLNQLEDNSKTAVEVARERAPSVTEQIFSIMNGGVSQSRGFSTVEEVVQDYQRRAGLHEYHNQIMAREIIDAGKSAEAQEEEDLEKKNEKPVILLRFPMIERYVENVLHTSPYIQLPAILQSIIEVFSKRGISAVDVEAKDFVRYLNKKMVEHRGQQDHHGADDYALGKDVGIYNDYVSYDANRDAFHGLLPRRVF